MAIITEEPEQQEPQPQPQHQQQEEKRKQKQKQKQNQNPSSNSTKPQHNTNPFTLWFYFTLSVSLITLFFVSLSSLSSNPDPRSWFLGLRDSLRQHYSSGRVIKVQPSPNQSPIEVFTFQNDAVSTENVLIVHGVGLSSFSFREMISSLGSKGVRVMAFDLPGNGFSDRSTMEIKESSNGAFEKLWDAFALIKEKGVFWAFDHIVETGQIPYEEIMKARDLGRERVRVIELGSEELGRVLGQVIETFNLAPVHLVLHDSALLMSANWVAENVDLVKSVTLMDTGSRPALPMLAFNLPLIREVLLGFSFAYERLIRLCCMNKIGGFDVEAHRLLLKGRDGFRAVVGMGKNLNYSFDIGEWGGSDGIKVMPMQVLWSSGWSKLWSEEGSRVADALPQAKFVKHSGGRWPQEDNAYELAESIAEFVSSLPKSVRQAKEEPIPEHIQKMFDEAKSGDHDHDHLHGHGSHDHHHGGHDHGHAAGYMDAYGLGNAWGH
ncbi:protein AUXIN RESPONSE 4 [Pistacia vera]|uniref:protein AUXIN RESPONSE 4 n=1 Tax=Pistacia vera TaxID=55513 RepID=UPI0012637AFC|nr:protein AUXIN RESPONSE 4 [Pistacia vera]